MLDWLKRKFTDVERIEELERKLRESQSKYERLNEEIEQNYVKDICAPNGIKFLEFIDKHGNQSVKYYNHSLNRSGFWDWNYEYELKHEWNPEICIILRDFLLKNFPLKQQSTIQNSRIVTKEDK